MYVVESRLVASFKRWSALFLFLIYDLLQVYIIGHLEVKPDDNLIIRYRFGWSDQFTLGGWMLAFLLTVPFIISYLIAIGSVANNRNMVQVLGPDSLMRRIRLEFAKGNPEGLEFTTENIHYLLEDMAQGEPPGTIENLEMLFSLGMIITNLLEKAGVKSVKRVYVSDDLAPNAFTLRFIPLPFIGQDWIIINRNVVDILDQNEITAVIAHEVGHAVRKDSWVNSFLYSPRIVIIFGWAVILAQMGAVILDQPFTGDSFLRIAFLLFFLVLVRLLMNLGQYFTGYAYRKTELLADYYAAKLVGSEILINALIKIGRRGEVLRTTNIELEWVEKQFDKLDTHRMTMQILNMLDPGETSKDKAREFAIKYYVQMKLTDTLKGLRIQPPQEQFEAMINESVQKLMQERGMQVSREQVQQRLGPERMEKYTKDWRSVDLDANEYLDQEEIKTLVTELRDKGKKIFETEALEEMGVLATPRTHPQVSDRIIFLYDNLMKK